MQDFGGEAERLRARGEAERDCLRARTGEAEWERLDRVYLSREWERDALLEDFRGDREPLAGDLDLVLLRDFRAWVSLVAVFMSSSCFASLGSVEGTAGASVEGWVSAEAVLSATMALSAT